MKEQLLAYRAGGARAAGKPGTPIRFVAGTEGVKRDGLNLIMTGMRLDNFRRNPVFLFGHDYVGTRLPIGRADVQLKGSQMLADVTFDQADEFAREVERKYRDGYMNAVSLGWNTLEMQGRDVTESELLDVSAVPVPGDADALMQRGLRRRHQAPAINPQDAIGEMRLLLAQATNNPKIMLDAFVRTVAEQELVKRGLR